MPTYLETAPHDTLPGLALSSWGDLDWDTGNNQAVVTGTGLADRWFYLHNGGMRVGARNDGTRYNTSISGRRTARCRRDLGSSDHYIRAVVNPFVTGSLEMGLAARFADGDGANTWYYAQIRPGDGDVRLWTVIGGTFTSTLATHSHTWAGGETLELRCHGSTISVWLDSGSGLTQVISVTNSAITSGSKVGLHASTGNGQACGWSDILMGPLDGSGNPVTSPITPGPPYLTFLAVGAVTATTGTVTAIPVNTVEARLIVATDDELTSVVHTSSWQAPDTDGIVRFPVTGLTADTTYHYGVEWDDGTSTGMFAEQGILKTFPTSGPVKIACVGDMGLAGTGQSNLPIDSLSKHTSNSRAIDYLMARDPDVLLFVGDYHYRDIAVRLTAYPDAYAHYLMMFRMMYANPRVGQMFRTVPCALTWDDHDYGGSDVDSTLATRQEARESYRALLPHYPLAEAGPNAHIGHTFVVGRTRVVVCDTRSDKLRAGGDASAWTMLGSAQLSWLLNIIDTFDQQFLVLVTGPPWIGTSTDDWGGFTIERAAIGQALHDAGLTERTLIVGADEHCVAIDDGTNSQYASTSDPGPHVLVCAPLGSNTSNKGGPYSEGFAPATVGPTVMHRQYAMAELDDQGATIDVDLRCFQLASNGDTESEVISLGFQVDADASSLDPPTGLMAVAASSTQINLSWNEEPAAHWYELNRQKKDGEDWVDDVVVEDILTTSYEDMDLEESTIYRYRVRSVAEVI